MTSAEVVEQQAMDGVDGFAAAGGFDALDEDLAEESAFDETDGLLDDDAFEEGLDALEEESGDALDAELLSDDGLAEDQDQDLAAEECEACEAAVEDFDELGEFSFRPESGLYVPAAPSLITGPAAIALARQLNPFVLEQMSADDADEFFKGIGRAFRGIGRGLGSVVSRVARAAPGLLKAVGPVLSQALPMIQSVAGKLGPWGMIASAGLGAARSLMEGKGLGGALQGALGGLTAGIPGVGGILSKLGGAGGLAKGLGSVLGGGGGGLGGLLGGLGGGGPLGSIMGALGGGRGPLGNVLGALAPSGGAGGGLAGLLGGFLGGGDGADDDADLDALADMADARQIPAALALPLGAGLAARAVARKGCSRALQLPANRPQLWRRARAAERTLLAAGARVRGSAGQRLRVMRAIARLATYILRQRGGRPQQVERAVHWAARRILALVQGAPTLGRVPAPIARRKLAARQQILRRVPMAALCRGTGRLAVAA